MPGSIHNDPFVNVNGKLVTKTNNSGGIQGGISNGAPIYFRTAFKPPATIGQQQQTARYDLGEGVLEAKGRHDPCVVPRAVPIVEAMAALVVMDALMAQTSREGMRLRLQPVVQEGSGKQLTLPVQQTGTNAGEKDVQKHLNGVAK